MMHYFLSKKSFLLSLVFVIANVMIAAPRSVQQAQQEALQLMNKQTANLARGQQIAAEPQLVFSKARRNADEGAYYYVFSSGKNLGFTIVSGDDRLPAIIGYTESGDYDADNLPANFVSFMQAYQDYVDNATDAEIEKVKRWRTMNATHGNVAPFLQSKWGQEAPYNNQCPLYNGVNTLTGCVATAMAQVLYYYKLPIPLLETIPAYVTETHRFSMPAIAAGEFYDWDNMLDKYTGNETVAQKNAVAKLMLHVGCSVNMDYTPDWSAASISSESLIKYFGMDKELTRLLWRKYYDLAEWDNILYQEMAEQRPVLYRGESTTEGGHIFVIHGYRDGLYYVNWGWGGASDGYFDITILNPYNTTSAEVSTSADGYGMGNCMVIGIQPDNGIADEVDMPFIYSYDNLSLSNARVTENTLSGTIYASPGNNNIWEGSAFASVGYKADNGNYVKIASEYEINSQRCPISYYYSYRSLSFSFQYEEGKVYRLVLIESQDGINWTPCEGAETTALSIQVQNGIVIDVTERPTLTAIVELDKGSSRGYTGMPNTINVTVTNTSSKEYYDCIYVLISRSSTMPNNYEYAAGITAPTNGSTTLDFVYTPTTEGTYNFWILDANMNVIGKSSVEFLLSTPPILSFVSITCDNASENKTIADYNGDSVEMNTVYDTTANFTFEIKNEGGYYVGNFYLYEYNVYYASQWYGYRHTLTIPADTIVKFTFTVESDADKVVGAWLSSDNESVSIQPLLADKYNKHYIYVNGLRTNGYYYFTDSEICYLAGSNDTAVEGIKVPNSSLSVTVGNGTITLKANADTDVRIVSMGGVQVARLMLNAGERTTVNVPAGIYVVNQQKVVVR